MDQTSIRTVSPRALMRLMRSRPLPVFSPMSMTATSGFCLADELQGLGQFGGFAADEQIDVPRNSQRESLTNCGMIIDDQHAVRLGGFVLRHVDSSSIPRRTILPVLASTEREHSLRARPKPKTSSMFHSRCQSASHNRSFGLGSINGQGRADHVGAIFHDPLSESFPLRQRPRNSVAIILDSQGALQIVLLKTDADFTSQSVSQRIAQRFLAIWNR